MRPVSTSSGKREGFMNAELYYNESALLLSLKHGVSTLTDASLGKDSADIIEPHYKQGDAARKPFQHCPALLGGNRDEDREQNQE